MRLGILLALAGLICGHALAEDVAEMYPAAAYRGQLAIIVDDLGYGLPPAEETLALPFDLTLAVIPFTPYGKHIAEQAAAIQREVMLHAPMETIEARKWENGLTSQMDQPALLSRMQAMLEDIPHVVGINNHGGSKLTQDRDRMDWLMALIADRGLFFVDSRTVATSEASAAAREARVPHTTRDIFLDNNKSTSSIMTQLEKASLRAQENGFAVAIGHPYPETLAVLGEMLPKLKRQGIEIARVSRVIKSSAYRSPLLANDAKFNKLTRKTPKSSNM